MSRLGPREPAASGLRSRLSIDQLLWVANTRHGPGGHWYARVRDDRGDHDHLDDAPDAVDYLARHRVSLPADPPTQRHLDRLRAVREMVRGLLVPDRPAWTPEAGRLLATTRFSIDPEHNLHALGDGWDRFIGDLLPPLLELIVQRDRMRICGNPACRLVFLDLSRNRGRRWCDTTGCGNRARVRRHRAAGR